MAAVLAGHVVGDATGHNWQPVRLSLGSHPYDANIASFAKMSVAQVKRHREGEWVEEEKSRTEVCPEGETDPNYTFPLRLKYLKGKKQAIKLECYLTNPGGNITAPLSGYEYYGEWEGALGACQKTHRTLSRRGLVAAITRPRVNQLRTISLRLSHLVPLHDPACVCVYPGLVVFRRRRDDRAGLYHAGAAGAQVSVIFQLRRGHMDRGRAAPDV